MREVRVGAIDWAEVAGVAVVIPVVVDWPELRLTEDQIVANAVAAADGHRPPFPNQSMFSVRIERPRYLSALPTWADVLWLIGQMELTDEELVLLRRQAQGDGRPQVMAVVDEVQRRRQEERDAEVVAAKVEEVTKTEALVNKATPPSPEPEPVKSEHAEKAKPAPHKVAAAHKKAHEH